MKKSAPKQEGFVCLHCDKQVFTNRKFAGTEFRNHCPFCLWSKHLGQKWPKNSGITCMGAMKPIGLTYKHDGWDKYGKLKQGELMLIHLCERCGAITINRLAADDKTEEVEYIYNESIKLDENLKNKIKEQEIRILEEADRTEIKKQLFGK